MLKIIIVLFNNNKIFFLAYFYHLENICNERILAKQLFENYIYEATKISLFQSGIEHKMLPLSLTKPRHLFLQ